MPRGKRRSSKGSKSGKVKGAVSPGKIASTVLGAGVGGIIGASRAGPVGAVLGATIGGLTGFEAGNRATKAAPELQRKKTNQSTDSSN